MHSCCSGLSCLTAAEQGDVGDVVDHGRLRAALRAAVGLVGVEHVAGGDLEPVPAGLEVVGDQVAGDGDQPGAEVAALPGEAADALERAQERVRGQVLGQRPVADPEVDEPEDGVDVAVVDEAERLGRRRPGPARPAPRPRRRRRPARAGWAIVPVGLRRHRAGAGCRPATPVGLAGAGGDGRRRDGRSSTVSSRAAGIVGRSVPTRDGCRSSWRRRSRRAPGSTARPVVGRRRPGASLRP